MRNATGKPIEFSIDGLPAEPPKAYKVPPGGTCEVPDGYCRAASAKLPSVIATIAPGLVPASEAVPEPVAETIAVSLEPVLGSPEPEHAVESVPIQQSVFRRKRNG